MADLDQELVDLLEGRVPRMDPAEHADEAYPAEVTMFDGAVITTQVYRVGRELYLDYGHARHLALITWLRSRAIREIRITGR